MQLKNNHTPAALPIRGNPKIVSSGHHRTVHIAWAGSGLTNIALSHFSSNKSGRLTEKTGTDRKAANGAFHGCINNHAVIDVEEVAVHVLGSIDALPEIGHAPPESLSSVLDDHAVLLHLSPGNQTPAVNSRLHHGQAVSKMCQGFSFGKAQLKKEMNGKDMLSKVSYCQEARVLSEAWLLGLL